MPGTAERSYGIHVARLAGMPDEVVDRSSEILANLKRVGWRPGYRNSRGATAAKAPIYRASSRSSIGLL